MADNRRQTIGGEPGESFTNTTGRVLWQLRVRFENSCGRCIADANRIGPRWPTPYHRGCNCTNVPIMPGATAEPFLDFQDEVRKLDKTQQRRVMGAANWRLVEAGVVAWEDVVNRQRIKTFREVVALKKLTVDQLRKAGIPRALAERTVADAETKRKTRNAVQSDAVARLRKLGVSDEQIRDEFKRRLKLRVLGGGGNPPPAGPGAAPPQPAPDPGPADPPPPPPPPAGPRGLSAKPSPNLQKRSLSWLESKVPALAAVWRRCREILGG